ncbi:glycoside hydrolase family 104 protein [uncultured Pseudacidovorax sp.]|uniref:glycoside hydrolase family 24 protein n=1 Tax=uncultured Pseudacidovorax sp. TaxID=679313 RepID=UPI0025FF22E4|nr:glycoside hydrolase family 104 protein [uncultured Pseudacidovorax sp.]
MDARMVVVGVVALGLLAWAATAYAGQAQGSDQQPAEEGGSWWGDGISQAIEDLGEEVDMSQQQNQQPAFSVNANVQAFLQAIKACEGTAGQPDPYRVCFAYSHVISDLSDHPAVTGEWSGVRLSDAQCKGAGQPAGCVSTAAGAYQITRTTWRDVRPKLGLPDFSAASQDAAAVELLRRCGAYARLAAGDLAGAVRAARGTWASLPGANYAGQGMRSMAQVQAWYSGAGGYTA